MNMALGAVAGKRAMVQSKNPEAAGSVSCALSLLYTTGHEWGASLFDRKRLAFVSFLFFISGQSKISSKLFSVLQPCHDVAGVCRGLGQWFCNQFRFINRPDNASPRLQVFLESCSFLTCGSTVAIKEKKVQLVGLRSQIPVHGHSLKPSAGDAELVVLVKSSEAFERTSAKVENPC
jgi:hypothetical protein